MQSLHVDRVFACAPATAFDVPAEHVGYAPVRDPASRARPGRLAAHVDARYFQPIGS